MLITFENGCSLYVRLCDCVCNLSKICQIFLVEWLWYFVGLVSWPIAAKKIALHVWGFVRGWVASTIYFVFGVFFFKFHIAHSHSKCTQLNWTKRYFFSAHCEWHVPFLLNFFFALLRSIARWMAKIFSGIGILKFFSIDIESVWNSIKLSGKV